MKVLGACWIACAIAAGLLLACEEERDERTDNMEDGYSCTDSAPIVFEKELNAGFRICKRL